MMHRHVYVGPAEPSPLSVRQAVGIDLELNLTFHQQNEGGVNRFDLTNAYPQIVLAPRSSRQVYGYDITPTDAVNGLGSVTVPGMVFNDPHGHNLEIFLRDANGKPTALVARGEAVPYWGSYQTSSPLSPMTIPVIEGPPGPTGPAGPSGTPGTRGSVWLTGTGDPSVAVGSAGVLPGDMYLDNSNGDVWRYDGTTWALT